MSTLIDCMVAVAVLSIGASVVIQQHTHYENANRRAIAVESVSRALDQEMERFRACADRACVEQLAERASEEHTDEVASWSRADIERTLEKGPNDTLKLTLKATVPSTHLEQKLVALLWVPK